jgi:hypothetical protein
MFRYQLYFAVIFSIVGILQVSDASANPSYPNAGDKHVAEQGSKIRIGQPATEPVALMQELSKVYANNPDIKSAYLALYHDPSKDKEPGLLISLEVESVDAMEKASAESGSVIDSLPKTHDHIDIIRFNPSGISGYFVENQIEPFYRRKDS